MSKIEVNKIGPQCGTTLTVGCGAGQTVAVDANTVTLGRCGGTVALASGASQTGFGRTGTVNWQTTPKTGDFTAANGEGYFVDTTSTAITMTMPSGTAGSIVSIQDYNKSFDDNSFTIAPATGQKINGGTASANLIISTEGQGLTFVYVDSTVGWKTVHENDFTLGGSSFITATGGTVATVGDDKIHTFTGPGTFCVSSGGSPTNAVVSYLVVAGGGGGGSGMGGGGGAGGFREFKSPVTPYTASPLDGNPGGTSISITGAAAFPIAVGGGGAGGAAPSSGSGCSGVASTFSTVSSAGGGGGAGTSKASIAGGSGGGAAYNALISPTGAPGGAGNTPPVTPSQGFPGGAGSNPVGAGNPPGPPCAATTSTGGGGATAAGGDWNSARPAAGSGGAGATTSINNTPTAYAGGGGGVYNTSGSNGAGGTGGGGAGATGPSGSGNAGTSGTTNTGGGGGAGGSTPTATGGVGGSGIVIIRYKFQ